MAPNPLVGTRISVEETRGSALVFEVCLNHVMLIKVKWKNSIHLLILTSTITAAQIMTMQMAKKIFKGFGGNVGKTNELIIVTCEKKLQEVTSFSLHYLV